MGASKINQVVFNRVKRDLKVGLHKDTIANLHDLSKDSIRKINNATSWKNWNDMKVGQRIKYSTSLKDTVLEYEEHSNWFMEKLRRLVR